MSMEELVMKMLFCLLAALVIGFLFGWLITRASAKGRYLGEIDELQEELLEKNNKIDHLHNTIESHALENKNLLTQVEVKEREALEFKDMVGKQKNDLLAARAELDLASKKVFEHEKNLSEYEAKVAQLHEVHSAKDKKIADLENDYNSLREEIDKLQKEQDNKEQEIQKIHQIKESYETKLNEYDSVINEKNAKVMQLETNLKSYEQKLAQKEQEIHSIQAKTKELESTLSQSSASSDLLETKSRELEEYRRRADELKRALSQKESELAQKDAHISTLEKIAKEVKTNPNTQSQSIMSQPAQTSESQSSDSGFGFFKMVKDTVSKLTESGEEIIKRGDDIIDDYKNKKS